MIKVNSAGTITMLYSKYVGGVYSYYERKKYRNGRECHAWVTMINGQQIVFELNPTFGEEMGAHFTVGGSYDRKECGGKIRISKWLMAVWEEAKALDIPRFIASAHQDDGLGEYRIKLYSKFGWRVDHDRCYADEDGPVIALICDN